MEEKGSDVNLAVHLVSDAYEERFETAVVVSTDSDLLGAVDFVRTRLHVPIGLLYPRPKLPTGFAEHFDFVKQIGKGVLAASQLPNPVTGPQGPIYRPSSW
jgi:hypothetical protein